METSLSMSLEQYDAFKEIFPSPASFRPVNPTKGRSVAKNTFEAPGEKHVPEHFDFYMDRRHGRNRDPPSSFVITGGIVGCLLFAPLIMYITFVRQNPDTFSMSAGGLFASNAIGRTGSQSRYGRMNS